MQITPVKTDIVNPGDSLEELIENALSGLQENTVLCISSKIVSLCENTLVEKSSYPNKRELIIREAQAYLPDDVSNPYNVHLTITKNLLIPTAGIDESNAKDIYILYPRDTMASAFGLWTHLRKKYRIRNLGILITDSRSTPLRRGVTGVGIGWCGFSPLYDYVGKTDCFGRELTFTKVNMLDALAAPAVLVMGEGNEQTPLAVIQEAPHITFQNRAPTAEEIAEITISLENDLYAPILMKAPWIRNKP